MGQRPFLAGIAFVLLAAAPRAAHAVPTFGGCALFPADNYWNTRVDHLPLHPNSAAWVASVGAATRLHPDWSNVLADGYGFMPAAVPATQPRVPISFPTPAAAIESEPGPYPIPPALAVPGGEREVVVVETGNCIAYELYGAPDGAGGWVASSAAIFDLRSNALRPDGHASLDQAGLPVIPGLMRWEEVAAGEVSHAIRFTATNAWGRVALPGGGTAMKYLWPARHGSGNSTDESLPPMGARFRLKASFDISGFDPRTQVVLRGMQRYGMVLASRGGNWFLQGVSDAGWPDTVIDELRSITGANFEVVDTAPLIVSVDSAQAVQPATLSDAPTNLAATPGLSAATFTFTPPAAPAAAITGYAVTCTPGPLTATGAQSPIVLAGLVAGTTYSCSVRAITAAGPGTPSTAISVTPGLANDAFPPGALPPGWTQPAGSIATWVVANDTAYAGTLSLRSGFAGDGQRSAIAYTAGFAAGNVTFARKVSSQAGDALEFHIDGVLQGRWSGEQEWVMASFPIPAGTHTLAWRYVKDGSGASGADAAWIDSVALPPLAPCRLRMPNRRCLPE